MKLYVLALGLAAVLTAQTPVSFLEGRNGGNGSAAATVVADLNNDGVPDVATVDPNNGVTIFLGNGDGSFRQLPPIGVVGSSIAAADFNQDGNIDLAVAGSVLLGNGDGSFQSPIVFDNSAVLVVTGDFNGDGIPDIAATSTFAATVQTFLGDGTGSFVAGPVTTISTSTLALNSMIVADFDSDGQDDLALAATTNFYGGTGYLEVLRGASQGNFSVSQVALGSSTFSRPSALAAADFNGDGHLDVAVADWYLNRVLIFLGTGGGFRTPIRVGVRPRQVRLPSRT